MSTNQSSLLKTIETSSTMNVKIVVYRASKPSNRYFPSFFKRFSRIAEQLFSIEGEERDYIAGNPSMRFSD